MSRRTLLITVLTLSLLVAGFGLVQAHSGYDHGRGHMMGGYGYGPMMGYGSYGNNGCWNTQEERRSSSGQAPRGARHRQDLPDLRITTSAFLIYAQGGRS